MHYDPRRIASNVAAPKNQPGSEKDEYPGHFSPASLELSPPQWSVWQ